MILLLGFAFVAGIFTILAPCIWPILPAVLSVSVGGGKYRPLLVVSGLITTFAVLTLFASWLVSLLGIDPNLLRWLAVVILILLGLTMVVPALATFFERAVGFLARRVGSSVSTTGGSWQSFVSGMALGIVWTPCAGPILATVATLAATQEVTGQVVLLMIAYNLGVAIPLLLIAYGGQVLISRTRFISAQTGHLQRFFGVIIIATAVLIGTGYDLTLQAKLLNAFPFLTAVSTRFEETDLISQQLDQLAGREGVIDKSKGAELKNLGQAPELIGITQWLNVDRALSLEELKGKVVLIDFWTYTCINCIRTLPYLRTWHQQYADDGLVIIGVHAPEFEFEKSTENVRQAIEKYQLEYAVAQDNDFATWRAYENRFWPAKYLIDATGEIRYAHFGEGAYQETEQAIQQLLEEAGLMSDQNTDVAAARLETPAVGATRGQTHETYLGYLRARELVNQEYKPDQVVDYQLLTPFSDTWSLGGAWRITEEHAISESDQSLIQLKFSAKEVYLVVEVDKPVEIKVTLDGESRPAVAVTESQLYTVIQSQEFLRRSVLELQVPKGVRLFAFTFGS